MPNWAENILKITGAPKRIQELREYIAGVDAEGNKLIFDFNKVVPMPEELGLTTSPNTVNASEMVGKYGFPDWYSFQSTKWGTKWNLNHDSVRVIDNGDSDPFIETLEMRFDTAWSAPDGVVKALGIQFPDLEIDLWTCDPAMDWGYHLSFHDGIEDEAETTYDQSVMDIFGHVHWEDEEEAIPQ